MVFSISIEVLLLNIVNFVLMLSILLMWFLFMLAFMDEKDGRWSKAEVSLLRDLKFEVLFAFVLLEYDIVDCNVVIEGLVQF